MKKAILQYWEESERGWGIRPDGCSIHPNKETLKKYVDGIYEGRSVNDVPDEYERIVGDPIEVWITDQIYVEMVSLEGTIRIPQHSMSNLRKLKEIQPMVEYETLN